MKATVSLWCVIAIVGSFAGSAARAGAAPPAPLSPAPGQITNGSLWKDGRPSLLPTAARPVVESTMVWEPTENDWKYSHHQSLTAFKGRLLALWSSSLRDEDSPGQRVVYSIRGDSGEWGKPRVLFQPDIQPDGRLRVLTAGGFHQHDGTLVAYAGDYSIDRKSTRLLARTSTDGETWAEVRDLNVPVCPNHGPQSTASGRLIIAGNTAFPYTDDPTGLSGWKMSGIYPATDKGFQDNPGTFWPLTKPMNWPANLCEGAFYQTDDGMLHMLLRATNIGDPGRVASQWVLYETRSADNGATWDSPQATAYSNSDAKFHFGRLPDGRFYCVSNPVGMGRMPLALSTSRDGVVFDRHYIIGERPYKRRFDGVAKGGHYGYPHSIVHDGSLYVIVSRQKESVEVLRVAVSDLREEKP